MFDSNVIVYVGFDHGHKLSLPFLFQIAAIRKTSKFEDEIREEQEEKKREAEEKNRRQQSFKERAALFGGKGV